jgi:Serine/threonine protein kinase
MSASVQPGDTVSHYRVLERIGAGGMGEVFVALDTRSGRRVAVKFLTASAQRRESFDRFQNEARLHARLFHANIARLFGFVADASPPFLVMEYVEGPTLKDWMGHGRAIDWHERLQVFAGIADGVGHLHANGIIHRDLKPGNVRLAADGRPKLLDFGIAKDAMTPNLTVTGSVVGTLQFLAPEQLEGKPADARSDVWALGVLLYELLTGRLPFASENLSDLMSNVRKCRFAAPTVVDAALPTALDKLVKTCLRPDPDDRPQDGASVAAAARAVLGSASGQADAGGVGRARPPGRRRSGLGLSPLAWVGIAGAAGAMLAVGIGYALLSSEEIVTPKAVSCDQEGSAGATFPVNIQGNGGTFEVWVNGTHCGTAGTDGIRFRAVVGTKIAYECRSIRHGATTSHEIIVGATNIYSCP